MSEVTASHKGAAGTQKTISTVTQTQLITALGLLPYWKPTTLTEITPHGPYQFVPADRNESGRARACTTEKKIGLQPHLHVESTREQSGSN